MPESERKRDNNVNRYTNRENEITRSNDTHIVSVIVIVVCRRTNAIARVYMYIVHTIVLIRSSVCSPSSSLFSSSILVHKYPRTLAQNSAQQSCFNITCRMLSIQNDIFDSIRWHLYVPPSADCRFRLFIISLYQRSLLGVCVCECARAPRAVCTATTHSTQQFT